MSMSDLVPLITRAAGVTAPTRAIPMVLMHLLAAANELYARISRRPVLLSWAMARTVASENDRSRYDPDRSVMELGLTFRPLADTLRDEVAWFRRHDRFPAGR